MDAVAFITGTDNEAFCISLVQEHTLVKPWQVNSRCVQYQSRHTGRAVIFSICIYDAIMLGNMYALGVLTQSYAMHPLKLCTKY